MKKNIFIISVILIHSFQFVTAMMLDHDFSPQEIAYFQNWMLHGFNSHSNNSTNYLPVVEIPQKPHKKVRKESPRIPSFCLLKLVKQNPQLTTKTKRKIRSLWAAGASNNFRHLGNWTSLEYARQHCNKNLVNFLENHKLRK